MKDRKRGNIFTYGLLLLTIDINVHVVCYVHWEDLTNLNEVGVYSQHMYVIFIILFFQLHLMKSIHESIKKDKFPQFVQEFMQTMFPNKVYPQWAVEAFASVGINIS